MLQFNCQSCLLLCLSCCNIALSQSPSDVLAERVRNEAPKAWKLYLSAWDKIKFDFNEIGTIGNEPVESSAGSLLLVYPNLLYKTTKKNDAVDSSHSYVVINKNYEFVLKESSEGNYNVKSVDKIHEIPRTGNINFPVLWDHPSPSVEILIARNLVRGLCLSPADWLPTLFEQPEFQIISVKEVIEGTERLVCVNYQYEPAQRKNQLARSGDVYLLPDHYWLIKKASVKLLEFNGKHLNTQITCEYDFESDTLPRLTSHKISTVEYDQIVQRNFTNYETVTSVQSEDFTLSHYGIPEPDFDGLHSQRIHPIRYILIGGGFLLIILALWMMYRKHQKQNDEKK